MSGPLWDFHAALKRARGSDLAYWPSVAAPVVVITRDAMLARWMKAMPAGLHEGAWRRVGVRWVSGESTAHVDNSTQWCDGQLMNAVVDLAAFLNLGVPVKESWASKVALYHDEVAQDAKANRRWWSKEC